MWVYVSKDISVHSLYAHLLTASQKDKTGQIGSVCEFMIVYIGENSIKHCVEKITF